MAHSTVSQLCFFSTTKPSRLVRGSTTSENVLFIKLVRLVKGFKFILPSLSSVQFSRSIVSDSLWPQGLQHVRLPCPSPTPGAYSNSCPSWWYHPTISFSVNPFSSCLQSFPALGTFQMSQFFESSGLSFGVSVSALVPPMNIQDSFPLAWTSWISLVSKGLSRVFSNTTVQNPRVSSYNFWNCT